MSFPVYVISLPRSVRRRERCFLLLSQFGLDFSFFDAIDGNNLTYDNISSIYDEKRNQKKFKRPLSFPELGCYISHINLWEKIANSDKPGAIVLEDDVEFVSEFMDVLLYLSKCDISNLLIKFNSLSNKIKTKNHVCTLPGGFSLIQPRIIPSRTTGYLIGKQAAADLLNSRKKIFRPIDNDLKHWWEYNISTLVINPSIVYQFSDINSRSSIEESRKQKKSSLSLIRFLNNMHYQLLFNYEAWTHHRHHIATTTFPAL
ncbi:hypothetical protein RL73_03145 [Liberibacter crescens]|nr:hypothetical protein RL73_03145 [Liberibacter crescens]